MSVEQLWQSVLESLQGVEGDGDSEDDAINKIAGIESLNDFADINIVEQYSKAFPAAGDPDQVLKTKSFGQVMVFFIKWRKEYAFEKRRFKLKQAAAQAGQ